tara:strand:+ start:220 stop:534 length:315 start_codon:yes stop_codon:yes gene_type:complete
MTRSESLKKAQKKYYNKIKEEKGVVFEKMRKNQLEYQKKYNKKQRENPEKLKEIREKNKIMAKKYYHNNKEKILEQRLSLRREREDKKLLDLITNNLIEVSVDN